MKRLVGTLCPDCKTTMYKDVSTTSSIPLKWVWYCPECGNELPIERRTNAATRSGEDVCLPCRRCGGKRTVTTYFDAGDHFSAGPAPGSGYQTYPCPECKGEHGE
jgi:DNA-directed RNA polymerase subunit M/transcription elongation factor TFIIS